MSLHKSRSYKPNLSPPKKVNTDPLVTKFESNWKEDMVRTIGDPIIRYQGQIDPNSKKRQGSGTYHYQNDFYSYDGEWHDGKKHGKGKLVMKDSLVYEGEFENGEITGEGVMTWANKNVYRGQFFNGEKHGLGLFITNYGEIYEGEFSHNLRHGKGILKSDNMIIEGYFFNNKPHGFVNISFSTGDRYEGNVNMGIKDGRGVFKSKERWIFDGEWKNDQRHGPGRIIMQDIGYEYEGEYENDKPKIFGNVIKISGRSQTIQASIDPVEKTSTIQKTQVSTANDTEIKNNLTYEINGALLDIEVAVMYQAPEYKDPIQPSKEEIEEQIKQAQKDAKKTKKVVNPDDFYKPRMILPPLVPLVYETGRVLEAILVTENVAGFAEPKTVRVDYRQSIKEAREKIAQQKVEWERQQLELKEQEAAAAAANTDPKAKKKPATKKAAPVQQPVEDAIKLFDLNEPEQNKALTLVTKQGKTVLEGFELPEDFPPGTYKLQIRDKTDPKAANPINLTEIEFQILGVGGAVDDKKKKKK